VTATITNSPTITATGTVTSTPTITSTGVATNTPSFGIHVWPNPFNPDTAVNGLLKAGVVPPGSTLSIYTVSGELVNSLQESGGLITWDGRNKNGALVSRGIYYYVVQSGQTVLLTNNIIVLTNR
jgi:flagellar hook assembly protein FlgD